MLRRKQPAGPLPTPQIQVLRPNTTWTDPVVGDTPVVARGGLPLPFVFFLNNIIGDYRTYTRTGMRGDFGL